jgi:hypothetical protein
MWLTHTFLICVETARTVLGYGGRAQFLIHVAPPTQFLIYVAHLRS